MPDPSERPENGKKEDAGPQRPRVNPRFSGSTWWLLLAVATVGLVIYYSRESNSPSDIDYGFFRRQLDTDKNIDSVNIEGMKLYGKFKTPR